MPLSRSQPNPETFLRLVMFCAAEKQQNRLTADGEHSVHAGVRARVLGQALGIDLGEIEDGVYGRPDERVARNEISHFDDSLNPPTTLNTRG